MPTRNPQSASVLSMINAMANKPDNSVEKRPDPYQDIKDMQKGSVPSEMGGKIGYEVKGKDVKLDMPEMPLGAEPQPEIKHNPIKAMVEAAIGPKTKRTETLAETKKQDEVIEETQQMVDRVSSATPSNGGNLDWLIAGGIPFAVGLMGGKYTAGAGAKAGSQNISDLLKQQREEILLARTLASKENQAFLKAQKSGKLQKQQFEDGTLGFFNPADGKYYTTDGQETDKKGTTLTTQKYADRAQIRDDFAQERDNRKIINTTERDYMKSQTGFNEALRDLEVAKNLIGRGDLQNRAAVMSIVKKIEGRMTDEDRNFYLEPNAGWRQFKEYAARYADGKLNERVLRNATDLLEQTILSIEEAKKSSTKRSRALLQSKGLSSKYIDDAFEKYDTVQKESSNVETRTTKEGITYEVIK